MKRLGMRASSTTVSGPTFSFCRIISSRHLSSPPVLVDAGTCSALDSTAVSPGSAGSG